ncbi:MAG: ATP-dependent helicase [Deferribacteraceae bacterium]|jgi:DNA helicase-2/ATP-dependent DNA helicase PcrA|nr:ATP-dependent helicase [Deferribacteraceae bacterium]
MIKSFETPADKTIAECLSLDNPKSFFLFAGAGSGKTRSLKNALEHIKETIGDTLLLLGKRVAVITFTNAAANEIKGRIQHNPLFAISTIHSFAWELIKGFDIDIKEWLRVKLTSDIEEKEDELERKRLNPRTKQTTIDNLTDSIAKKRQRLEVLDTIKHFNYDPTPSAVNSNKDSLSHSEVLGICASFLKEKSLMAKILIQRFPILLIDESQDTNKDLMEAFLFTQQSHSSSFSLGLLGDTKQRIYGGGKDDLGATCIALNFLTPSKPINHRSGSRIIELANKIGSLIDDTPTQTAVDTNGTGVIRLFIVPTKVNKAVAEQQIKEKMAEITGDTLWKKDMWENEEGATLVLEHRMAAIRLEYVEMWDSLKDLKEFDSIKDGSSADINWFANFIMPLVQTENPFEIAKITKKNNKDLFKKADKERLEKIKNNVNKIRESYANNPDITFEAIVKIVREGGIFEIPRKYNEESERFASFFATKFSQIIPYSKYVNETSDFRTHHGVKGLQFDRVMAIVDNESNWNTYNHAQLFLNGSANDSTLRLLYVICTRAKKSLAIVLYADMAQENIASSLFAESEIIVLN